MKIAITYDINSTLIEQHFGESRFFLIAEDKYGQVKTQVINNGGNSHKDLIPYLKVWGWTSLSAGGLGITRLNCFTITASKFCLDARGRPTMP